VEANTKRDELEALRREVESLNSRMERLQGEVATEEVLDQPHVSRDYFIYHATAGTILGIVGSMASLIFNIIGSLVAGKAAFELIRIYLTFPLGERALQLTSGGANVYAVGDGMIIALGCCLYMGTGMVLGIPVVLVLNKYFPKANLIVRLIVASVLSLAIWGINFYGILSWLQPQLFGGTWIIDGKLLPWWVAAATHVVFGGTIALLYPFFDTTPTPAKA
jgi:hypothetical protein